MIRLLCLSGVVAMALATTTALPSPYAQNSSVPATHAVQRPVAKLRLPRELKIVWHKEERAHLKAMPKEQRRGWLKRRWAAMSMSDKEHKIAELRAKWNRLPADVRQAMLQRKEQRREARRMQKAETSATRQSPAQPGP